MARQQAVAAQGFYATPPEILPLIAGLIEPATSPAPGLDPCAGQGEAMAFLASAWNLAPHLVEINTERGEDCRQVTGNTLVMDYAYVTALLPHLTPPNPSCTTRP